VALQNETFAFAQAHFHAPSEHKINGRVMDGEAHFVHKGSNGRLLVVGMFLESTGCGETEGFAAKLVDALDDAKEHHPVTASLYVLWLDLQLEMAQSSLTLDLSSPFQWLVPYACARRHQGRTNLQLCWQPYDAKL
jgi:hypothetical protein